MPDTAVIPLLGLPRTELEAIAERLGQPSYRGRQLAEWLYAHSAGSFDAMTSLPAALRERLAERYQVGRAPIATSQTSSDGTVKILLELADGERVEAVGLPYPDRVSTCVSSQTGCAVGCTFCATGYLGAGRNLTPGEMIDQVLSAGDAAERRISHVVFMGMGEPMLNLSNVLAAIHLFHDELGISPRRVTVSTVGIPTGIARLAREDLPLTLAVSLHAADDELRRELIPTTARKWTVEEVLAAARGYAGETGRRVTYEVVLLAGVNDRVQDAQAMAARLKPGEHVNLIPFNAVSEAGFQRPPSDRIATFRQILEAVGVVVTQRQTRGADIDSACGQLRAKSTLRGG